MKTLKLFYRHIGNMGDLLNPILFRELFGYEAKETVHRFKCDATGIGSGLGHFFVTRDSPYFVAQPKRTLVDAYLAAQPPLRFWSTGFMSHPRGEEFALRRRAVYGCVRGELSRRRIEKIIGKPLPIPTADGGLLVERLPLGAIEKRHSVGIIPHFREAQEPAFLALAEHYKGALLIDVRDDPLTVVRQIASCDHILSSSLHGLIVADAFHIPNLYIRCTDKPLGDGFKFADYYSAYGLPLAPLDILKEPMPTQNQIIDRYKVRSADVEAKKAILLATFPHA